MGQVATRSSSDSGRESPSEGNAEYSTHAASYSAGQQNTNPASSAPSTLWHAASAVNRTTRQMETMANTSTPEFPSKEKKKTLLFARKPHAPQAQSQSKHGRQFREPPVSVPTPPPLGMRPYLSPASEYCHAAVSSGEAQQRRSTENLDKMIVLAAEEAFTVPTGELECLASGFLSIADYIYVAETVRGLSNLLLSEDGRAMQKIAAASKSTPDSGSFNNSASSPVTPVEMPAAANKLNAVGALINTTGAGEMAALHWSLMREALLSCRTVRSKSVSGVSHATLMMTAATLSMQESTTTDIPSRAASEQHTTVFNESLPDNASRHDLSLTDRSPSSAETGLPDGEGSLNANQSNGSRSAGGGGGAAGVAGYGQLPSNRPLGITPASTALGSGASRTSTSAVTPLQNTLTSGLQPSGVFAEAVRPLSMGDLIDITTQDDVLDVYLNSAARKMRGLSRKLRVLTPIAAFRYCVAMHFRSVVATYKPGYVPSPPPAGAAPPDVSGAASILAEEERRRKRLKEGVTTSDKFGDAEWVIADTVVERPPTDGEVQAKLLREESLAMVGDDARKLFRDTKGLLLKALTNFANAMPLGINSRINNNYLLPTLPITADFIGCGVYTRRRQEFFVSIADRVKMLQGHSSFQSPEALLLGISQLSNLASQMLSSFAVCAALSCMSRWRELYESGFSNTDQIGDLMETFATSYCSGYDIMCNEAFPTLRKQYPNVFVVSSFAIKDEEGGRPPIVTVAVSALIKLLFLFAGGLESIRADDRRMMADALKKERSRRESQAHRSASPTPRASGVAAAAGNENSMSHRTAGTTQTSSGGGGGGNANNNNSNSHPHDLSALLPSDGLDSHEVSVNADRRRGTFAGEALSNSRRSHLSSLIRSANHAADADSATSTMMTDDVALVTALQVPSASVLVMVGSMILCDPLTTQAPSTHDSVRLARAVSRMWKVLFQTAGLLPHGPACPTEMAQWLPLFPMYAVSVEAKRALLQVYAKTARLSPLCIGPIAREDVLRSTAELVADVLHAEQEGRAGGQGTPSMRPSTLGLTTPPTQSSTTARTSSIGHMPPPPMDIGVTVQQQQQTASVATTAADDGTAVSRTSTEPHKDSDRVSYSTERGGAGVSVSHSIMPVFTLLSKRAANTAQVMYGLRSGSRFEQAHMSPQLAKELRTDLYELTSRQLTVPFLPGINLAREVRAVPLPGGISMFRTEKLADHSAATLKSLQQYKNKLAIVVAWRRSAVIARMVSSGTNGSSIAYRGGSVVCTGGRPTRSSQGPNSLADDSSAAAAAAAFVFPIAKGDELTIRWSDPVTTRASLHLDNPLTSPITTTTGASAEEVEGKRNSDSNSKSAMSAAPPAPQRHVVLAVLPTTSAHQCVIVLDASNYLASYVTEDTRNATAAAAGLPLPSSEDPRKNTAITTLAGGGVRRADTGNGRRQSVMSIQSLGFVYLEAAAAAAPTIDDLLLYRRQTPVLKRDGETACAWTNPDFAAHLRNAGPALAAPTAGNGQLTLATPQTQSQRNLSSGTTASMSLARTEFAVPLLLGWMLGQAPGNDVLLSLPLPPLAFRILSLAVHLEQTIDEVRLDGADVSLQNPDFSDSELCQHKLAELQQHLQAHLAATNGGGARAGTDDVHLSGSPALARRQYQRLKHQLADVLVSMSWNGHGSDATARAFWSAVLQGVRQTPLPHTPVFAHCCARTLQEVLCGQYDRPDQDFSFRDSFLLVTSLNAPSNVYRSYVQKCCVHVLDEEFSVSEKRLLLRFITGHSLRQHAAWEEVICVDMQHQFSTVSETAAHRGTVQLARALKGTSTIKIEADVGHNKDDGEAGADEKPKMCVSRAAMDATLQLLPVGRTTDNTLVIPNYFEALLMGTYRERVLGADYPWLANRGESSSGEAAAATTHTTYPDRDTPVILEENDFQFAWASLALGQQESLKRRFREMLVQRLRAALYAFLVGHDDCIEQSWELAEKLGLAGSATGGNSNEAAAAKAPLGASGDHEGQNGGRGAALLSGAGAFMRRHDGTLCFLDSELALAGMMDDLEEVPFDETDYFDDDSVSGSQEGSMGDGELLLNNSAFGIFGDEHSVDGVPNSNEMSINSMDEEQQNEDYAAEGEDLNGYRTAASFCFDDDDDVPPADLLGGGDVATDSDRSDKEDEEDSGEAVEPQKTVKDDTAAAAAAVLVKPAAEQTKTMTENDIDTTVSLMKDEAPATIAHETHRRSSGGSGDHLAPMAVAPARKGSLVTQGMSTLLQQARVSRGASLASTPTTQSPSTSLTSRLPVAAKTSTSSSTPPRRPSYALGISAATAAVQTPPAAAAKSKPKKNSLMAEVDADIQELFPDEDMFSI